MGEGKGGGMRSFVFPAFVRAVRRFQAKGFTKVPGATSLYGFLSKVLTPRGIVRLECEGNTMYLDSRDQGLFPRLVLGVHEMPGIRLFKKLIVPGMVVLDIGANVGYYTLIAARLMRGEGRVYAFEPEPGNYELLVKNIKANRCTNVTAVPKAVAERNGRVELFLDGINFGGPSLSRQNIPGSSGSVSIETVALDSYLEEAASGKVDVIKMDTQGTEGRILEGAVKTLSVSHPKIIMEFWPFGLRNMGTDPLALLARFRGMGFAVHRILEGGDVARVTEPARILEECMRMDGGRGDILLYLEK
jgi:FkbM family methyltransferase